MNIVSMKEVVEATTHDKIEIERDLDAMRRKIKEAIKPFIKVELHNTIESEIKEFPEHTMFLGLEKLKTMKEAMVYLLYNSYDITEMVLSKDYYWIHVNYQVDLNRDSYEQKYKSKRAAKERIIAGMKVLMGYAGKILIDYGFETIGENCSLTSKWQLDAKGEIILGDNFSFRIPRNIDDMIVEYIGLVDQLHDKTYKLMAMTMELNQQEAIRLWKEA
ncbi:MAG: hypothetical protein PUC65_03465 [Clostridiales bacterium]|nr:hypothetical protein [Clostridiales bacterium]